MPATCTAASCDILGLLITVAQLGQFLPQHWEMMVDKNVVGVSPYLLFFNSLYTLLAALDIVLLDAYDTLTCTSSPYRCFIDAQPLIQMLGSAALCAGMWYWFLRFHHESEDADPEERRLFNNFFYSGDAKAFYSAFIASAASFLLVAVVLVAEHGLHSSVVQSYAHFCGILSAFLNAVMWIPQIFVTAAYGHKGALSFGWVFLSVVMDVTLSAYLAAMGAHWSIWANNVPDGIQTSILLIILVKLEYQDNKRKTEYERLHRMEDGEPIVSR